MNTVDLIKKALKTVDDNTFDCYVYASEGGRCGSAWDDNSELELSANELLYLISQRLDVNPEVFDGLNLTEVDVQAKIIELAYEGAFPEGGPYATVNSVIPEELGELGEMLEGFDDSDEEAANEIRGRLETIGEDDYTFTFDIKDAITCETMKEGVNESIHLSSPEVLGLLHSEYGHDKLFEDIDYEDADEDLINGKAAQRGFAEDYNPFSCDGMCEALEVYLDSWDTIIDKIKGGEVTEDNLDNWLEYFDDSHNFEEDIESWMDEQEFDEDSDGEADEDGVVHGSGGLCYDDSDESLHLCRNCEYYVCYESTCQFFEKEVGEYDSCNEFTSCGY